MTRNLTDASLYKKHVFPRKKSCAMILRVCCMYSAAHDLTDNIIMMLLQAHEFKSFKEKKKHCDIHDIMKNKKIPLIQAFFEYNAFGTSLLFSLFIF